MLAVGQLQTHDVRAALGLVHVDGVDGFYVVLALENQTLSSVVAPYHVLVDEEVLGKVRAGGEAKYHVKKAVDGAGRQAALGGAQAEDGNGNLLVRGDLGQDRIALGSVLDLRMGADQVLRQEGGLL